MSYDFDGKKKEGLKRGEKLFKGVLRDKFILENAEEDLDDYYEKQKSTTPGLDRGSDLFKHLKNSPETTDGAFSIVKKSGPVSSVESTPDNDNGVGYVESKKVPEKSYMPNGCSGPNGCSAKQMKGDPKENVGPGKCKECGYSLSEKDENYGECTNNGCSIGRREMALRATQEEKENDSSSDHAEGFLGEVGLKEENCLMSDKDKKVEYPHDVFENDKLGLNRGTNKYGHQ